ncbi:polysaccharide biosynthesis tyrosine autokinase [Soonwooa sp.]|uniref:GumC family protein n=1 Tax=Soonwooa sp. TaxID=1938592 RepID=UPI0028A6F03F|nr:polysaccharide biosynthesis tyrosine autokinase [Soonwooa sp.]
MSSSSKTEITSSDEINLREIAKPYINKWRWFFISLLCTLALAFFYIKTTPSVYEIQSTVLIRDVKKSALDFGAIADLSSFGGKTSSAINNELEIFKSKKLIKDVVENLNLQIRVFSKKDLLKQEIYGESSPIIVKLVSERNTKEYALSKKKIKPVDIDIKGDRLELSGDNLPQPIITTYNKTINLPYATIIILKNPKFNNLYKKTLGELSFEYTSISKTITALQKESDVKLVDKEATVVGLSIEESNIEKGEAYINRLVDAFNQDAIIDKNSESQKTIEFIDSRIGIIAKELGEVEDQKERFKKENKITDIVEEAKLNLETSTKTRLDLVGVDTQLELNNSLINYLQKQGSNQVLPSAIGLNNPTASANISIYNDLIMQRNRLLENATPQNPAVVDLTKQISNVKNAVIDNLYKNKANIEALRNQLQSELQNTSSKISRVPTQEKMFRSIERQQSIKESLYLILLQKREESAIALANTTPKAKIVDYAYPSEKPVAPKKLIVLLLAMVGGFAIPFALIYIKELLNDKIRSKHDLEKYTNTSIIGELPSVVKGGAEVVQPNDLSPLAEAFRILITNLNFMLPRKDKGKVVFVTSSVKGEGKTFTSVNLALTLASPKVKVIIIGADIRNPQLQRYNTSRKGFEGLTEYLYDSSKNTKDITHVSTFNPDLDVIYSGSIPPNPTELLSNGRIEQLIESLKPHYEYIIVDTAPLMLVTDSLLFSYLSDVTLYVTRSGYTEKNIISFANDTIATGKINNVAFVVNDVSKDHFGYGNKYGYGYNQTEEKSWWKKLFGK